MSDSPPSRAPLIAGSVAVGGCVVLAAVCLMVVPVVGVLAAIAIPNFIAMQLKAKRSEVPGNVDGIKTAQLAYDAAFDVYVPVGSRDEAESELWGSGGKVPRPWKGGDDWTTIGWRPDGDVRGVYWVEVAPGGEDFTVHGLCDVDGDGDFAEYTATSRTNATLVSDYNTY